MSACVMSDVRPPTSVSAAAAGPAGPGRGGGGAPAATYGRMRAYLEEAAAARHTGQESRTIEAICPWTRPRLHPAAQTGGAARVPCADLLLH
eukprot:SAG31_NODE_280_length_18592_cov_33.584113_10_plen_92_part_00